MGKEGSGSFWINADFRVQRGDLPLLAEGRRAVRSPHLNFLNFCKILQNFTFFLKSSEFENFAKLYKILYFFEKF